MAVQGPAAHSHVSQNLSPDNRISQTGMSNGTAGVIFTVHPFHISVLYIRAYKKDFWK